MKKNKKANIFDDIKVKKAKKQRTKYVISLTINHASEMSDERKKEIANWLRKEAKALIKTGVKSRVKIIKIFHRIINCQIFFFNFLCH